MAGTATVLTGAGPHIVGQAVDVSRHGLGLELRRPVLPGRCVTAILELPDLWEEVPAISATVLTSRRLDRDRYRLGLEVERVPKVFDEVLRQAAGPRRIPARSDDLFMVLHAVSREVLYQAAWARLEAEHYESALSAAACALDGDPDNRLYRALVYRAAAEAALASGQWGDALWHFLKAHAYAPRDAHIQSRLSGLRRRHPSAQPLAA